MSYIETSIAAHRSQFSINMFVKYAWPILLEKHGLQNVANTCSFVYYKVAPLAHSMTLWGSKGDGKVVGGHRPGGT